MGAGKMGAAMLQGWLKTGLPGKSVTIIDPRPSDHVTALADAHGCAVNPDTATIGPQDVLVIAVKPQMLDAAAGMLRQVASSNTLIISVMAGKTIADMRSRLPQCERFIRAMPNTPAAVGRGITGMAASESVSAVERSVATRLLSGIGKVEWLRGEHEIDMVTAVSGSGPAYVFYLVECLAKAGAAAGLEPDLAMRLARATIEGAGELLHQDAAAASTLRENVTSPGGTTAAALAVLMADDGLAPLMRHAVDAAKRRAAELAG
ncbi:MAG: pyrroline-5-carboxylate reductase [Beijerinckiaceae bacterium]|nr:pyrroline-5-carboxylate reductase [Beijerinckiaceae bacterium]